MTIPKKPTRQRTSSPKIPAAKAPPKVAAKPEPKSTGRPERKGPSETLIAETILRLLAAREAGKTLPNAIGEVREKSIFMVPR